MDLKTVTDHLSGVLPDRRVAMLWHAVNALEDGIAAGVVRNQAFVQSKDVINRVVEEAAEAFLATGPCYADRHKSDWWGRAYDAEALIHGAHTLPTVLRRARERFGLDEYADFIEKALLPLRALLEQAKPLVKKRGEAGHPPPPKTEEQLAREAAQMTCQCCGRPILANTGAIALHGYQRPGDGWQTPSCYGAGAAPFEVSRDRLGKRILGLNDQVVAASIERASIEAEQKPVAVSYVDYAAPRYSNGKRPIRTVVVTRETFEEKSRELPNVIRGPVTFDRVKAECLGELDRQTAGIIDEIKAQQARYDGWTQTHTWDAEAKEWAPIVSMEAA